MKKKLLVLVSLIACVFLLSGCEQGGETKIMTCKRDAKQDNLDMSLNYKVTYRGDYVKKVETKEILKSSNSATLKGYKEAIEKTYKNFDDIKYYDYDVKINGDTLTSTVSINYEKIDTDKCTFVNDVKQNFIKK